MNEYSDHILSKAISISLDKFTRNQSVDCLYFIAKTWLEKKRWDTQMIETYIILHACFTNYTLQSQSKEKFTNGLPCLLYNR